MTADDPNHELLDGLTEPQRDAVTTTEGPLLVLAGPGSGKTRVITRRVAYLLALGVPPWQVIAVTFTNKAAGEMRQRVAHLVEDARDPDRVMRGLTISTFHALCARLLRRYAPLMQESPRWGISPNYTIYDSDDQTALMRRIIKDADLSTSNFPPRTVLAAISNAKNELLDEHAFASTAHDFHARTIAALFERYQRALRAADAVDFDDLLVMTVRMLEACDEARAEVQARWRYLMIDEYQDTNRAQFKLSTLIVGADEGVPPNVCVVGDPDQSIYGWRGADITNILEFESQYRGARVITLGENFRSTAPILATADHLIRHNTRRRHKALYTALPGGTPPTVVRTQDEHHEARLVVDWFRRLREGDTDEPDQGELQWKDMAVFYRNNALSRVIEDALRRAAIPYVIARGTAFYQREEVKDAVAYLRVVANPADDLSLARILNKPARKIGSTSAARIADRAAQRAVPLLDALRDARDVDDVSNVAQNAIERFLAMLDAWTGAGSFLGADVPGSLAELVERVVRESGLEAHYKKQQTNAESDEDRVANLEELVSAARDFEFDYDVSRDPALAEVPAPGANTTTDDQPAPPLLAMLRAFLESVALVADADKVDPAKGAVTLMTLHAAKGLEFPAVAIIGLEEGLLPSMRAMDSDAQLEEERRLAFVGITRAMRHLLITNARKRTQRGVSERTIPSRFLDELPDDAITRSDQSDPLTGLRDGADAGSWDDFEFDQTDPAERLERARRARSPTGAAERFTPGMHVRHPQFGVGTIVEVIGLGTRRRATVRFRDVGQKTLILEHARLVPVA